MQRERAMPTSSRCSSHFNQGVWHSNKRIIWASHPQQMPLEGEPKSLRHGLGELSQLFLAMQAIPAESPHVHTDTRYPCCALPKLQAYKTVINTQGCCFMPLSVYMVCYTRTKSNNMCLTFCLDKLRPLIL